MVEKYYNLRRILVVLVYLHSYISYIFMTVTQAFRG